MRGKYKFTLFVFFLFFLIKADFCLAESSVPVNSDNSFELKIKEKSFELPYAEKEKWITTDIRLAYNPFYKSEIENSNFCQIEKSIICRLTFFSKNENRIQKISKNTINKDLVEKFLDDLARSANHDPQDAKFSIEDGEVSVFSLSEKGIELDKEKSIDLLATFFREDTTPQKKVIELPYKEISPEISIDSIDSMGITSLIGEGKSNFRGSPKNRIHNIRVGANRFNGVLIKPDEEFSFVKILGEVDAEHGYLPELVIKHDKTEPEFGGGICQVSTTAFRAAIYSGLEITARRNHAYPVAYYNPQGMDATIYIPRPDLRFKNNTPGYILIQTKISGTELIFDFYGTDGGRKIEVIGPKILERKPDGSMKTTFTQKVFDKGGEIIIEAIFNSNYDSPDKYPHPGQESGTLTSKPNGWSDKEWSRYKKEHGI